MERCATLRKCPLKRGKSKRIFGDGDGPPMYCCAGLQALRTGFWPKWDNGIRLCYKVGGMGWEKRKGNGAWNVEEKGCSQCNWDEEGKQQWGWNNREEPWEKNQEINFSVEQGFHGPFYPGSRVDKAQWMTKYKSKPKDNDEADMNTK